MHPDLDSERQKRPTKRILKRNFMFVKSWISLWSFGDFSWALIGVHGGL
jgi:hypothetical protein